MRLALLFTVCLAGMAQEGDPQLLGRWRSMDNGKGGIGAMYEFRSNGTIDFSPGAILDMSYRVEGPDLVFLASESTGPEQRIKIDVTSAGKLRMISPGQPAEEFRREGAVIDPGQPLLGEWIGSRVMDGRRMTTHWIFTAATAGAPGKALFLMPFASQKGNYLVKTGGMSAAFPNGTLQGRYTIKNDVLTLTRSADRVQRFARY